MELSRTTEPTRKRVTIHPCTDMKETGDMALYLWGSTLITPSHHVIMSSLYLLTLMLTLDRHI